MNGSSHQKVERSIEYHEAVVRPVRTTARTGLHANGLSLYRKNASELHARLVPRVEHVGGAHTAPYSRTRTSRPPQARPAPSTSEVAQTKAEAAASQLSRRQSRTHDFEGSLPAVTRDSPDVPNKRVSVVAPGVSFQHLRRGHGTHRRLSRVPQWRFRAPAKAPVRPQTARPGLGPADRAVGEDLVPSHL